MRSRQRKHSKRHRLTSCTHVTSTDIENVFKGIVWDVRDPIHAATWLPDRNVDHVVLRTEICSGNVKLLLPVGPNNIASTRKIEVYYQETIKARRITVGDVLKRIYRFYNVQRVHSDDLSYMSIADVDLGSKILQTYYMNPASIRSLRFVHFMKSRTNFKGLVHQGGTFYSVNIG